MNERKITKYVVVFVLVAAALIGGRGNVESYNPCPADMSYIPAGRYYGGSSEEEVNYITKLCDLTVGGCYKSWFKNESPRRRVKHDSFCIDKYEYPNRDGQYPLTGVNFERAEQTCAQQGKRLCRSVEWERACISGVNANVWAYGHMYRDGFCNDWSEEILPAGYKRNCRTKEGVYDMNGNAAEWVEGMSGVISGGRLTTYNVMKGGSFRARPVFSRCNFIDIQDRKAAFGDFGFRCCSDMQQGVVLKSR